MSRRTFKDYVSQIMSITLQCRIIRNLCCHFLLLSNHHHLLLDYLIFPLKNNLFLSYFKDSASPSYING